MQLLFDIEEETIPDIKGLSYIPDFISHDEECALIEVIDQQPWLSDLKRRVQHYGYKYDYKARSVTKGAYLGPLPDWLQSIVNRLKDQSIFEQLPDQAAQAFEARAA